MSNLKFVSANHEVMRAYENRESLKIYLDFSTEVSLGFLTPVSG